MHLDWRDGLFACEADGRQIVLDLHCGRYAAISPPAVAALRHAQGGGDLSDRDRNLLEPLISCGHLVAAESRREQTPAGPPSQQLRSHREHASRRRDLLAAIAAQLVARAALRLLGFRRIHQLLATSIRPAGSRTPTTQRAAVARLADAFRRSELIVSRHDRCLARSVAFRILAAPQKLDVRLVIGVRGVPFAAHCWTEHEGVLLNDDLEVVSQFVPILSV